MQKIRINETTLKKIIYESTKKVLQEISPELKAAAAMTAADRSDNTKYTNGVYSAKLRRQADAFADSAAKDFEKQNPTMTDVRFDPHTRGLDATFNGYNGDGKSIRYLDNDYDFDKGRYSEPISSAVNQYGVPLLGHYDTYNSPEDGFVNDPSTPDRDVRRFGRFKDKYFKTRDKIRNYKATY